ncbi:hypothetical protein [Pseudomonas lopnurensis]|uniref:hypothetical protein n=1 Tax=Pseudomonas lopnurensis TaxID=1477517 RepID=UPI0028AC1D25|nr:hypothetical protein [Pseudomonas lopnurensis]
MQAVKRVENFRNVSFRFLGADIWPVVRNSIMTSSTHARSSPVTSRSIKVIPTLLDAAKLLFTSKKVHTLILTSDKFTESLSGNIYYKGAQSFIDHCSEENKRAEVLVQGKNNNRSLNLSVRSIFFYSGACYILAKLLVVLDRFSGVDSYAKDCILQFSREANGQALMAEKKALLRNIYVVAFLSAFFKFYLKRVKPEKCYVICYYSCLGMAFCSACNQLNIDVFDIQHGMSGKNMRAYGQWENTYGITYNTLPKFFLCWTKFDKMAIDYWIEAGNNSKSKKALVTGDLWKNYIENNKLDGFQVRNLASLLPQGGQRTFVLITLNSLSLNETFADLINRSSPNIFFLIRAHPNNRNIAKLREFEQTIKRINSNISVINATLFPMQAVIKSTDIHVTEWSASVYDAYLEGVFSIVTSPVGRDYFEDFIASGYVAYISSVDELISIIERTAET